MERRSYNPGPTSQEAKATADAAKATADAAMSKANATQTQLTNIPKVPWLGLKVVNVPALVLGGSVDLSISWDTAAPAADYAVAAAVEGTAAIIGTVSVAIKPGSKTINGCVITVKSSALLTNGSAQISVVAGRSANQA